MGRTAEMEMRDALEDFTNAVERRAVREEQSSAHDPDVEEARAVEKRAADRIVWLALGGTPQDPPADQIKRLSDVLVTEIPADPALESAANACDIAISILRRDSTSAGKGLTLGRLLHVCRRRYKDPVLLEDVTAAFFGKLPAPSDTPTVTKPFDACDAPGCESVACVYDLADPLPEGWTRVVISGPPARSKIALRCPVHPLPEGGVVTVAGQRVSPAPTPTPAIVCPISKRAQERWEANNPSFGDVVQRLRWLETLVVGMPR